MAGSDEEQKKRREEERRNEQIALIEAALYVAGRPLDLKTLSRIIGSRSQRKAGELARTLMMEYRRRNTSLEVLELKDQRFVLQLKTKYASKVRRLAVRPLLTDGPLRTLAYIAYKQPVSQKQVIATRGTHAYRHIRQLLEFGLVEREQKGRNKVLRATEFFADYFGLSHNPVTMRRQLIRILNTLASERGEKTNKKGPEKG
ncbi:MAG: putative transcriptional regulator [Candidatus Bathyarchaeota archaeon B63]|nr:MAG: putative transcriptional regulator [Candidatus Bathyarchaeota archaeon B63]